MAYEVEQLLSKKIGEIEERQRLRKEDEMRQLSAKEKEINAQKRHKKRLEEKNLRESKKSYILDVMDKLTSWRFTADEAFDPTSTSFFDYIWSFSRYLWKHGIISSDDILLLQVCIDNRS